ENRIMYRLFVAIALPDSIKKALLSIACGVPGARWVEEDQMHFTLRFIGEVDGKIFRAIEDALANIQADALTLTLKGVGHFPPRGQPRILWVGLEKNEALLQLKNKIDHALRRVGVESDKRKFFPHITLARLRQTHASRVGRFLVENGLFRC